MLSPTSPLNLYKEEVRLETFKKWPVKFISKEKLAKTGFFLTEPCTDIVQCYFCKVKLGFWTKYDDVVDEHIRWSPNCPIIQRRSTNNMPINLTELNQLLPPVSYDVCGNMTGNAYSLHQYHGEDAIEEIIVSVYRFLKRVFQYGQRKCSRFFE